MPIDPYMYLYAQVCIYGVCVCEITLYLSNCIEPEWAMTAVVRIWLTPIAEAKKSTLPTCDGTATAIIDNKL